MQPDSFLMQPDSLGLISKLMQIATGVAAIFIAFIVYKYNKKRGKETLVARSWSIQQQINLSVINNRDVLRAAEIIKCDCIDRNTTDEDLQRLIYIYFLYINRVKMMWDGWRSGLINRDELLDDVFPTITLIGGHKEIIDYCLTRGYSKEFRNFFLKELARVGDMNDKIIGSKQFIEKFRS
ncbi:MAG: hypothetical protein AAGI34_05985 [Pseudomonadota bacterium]